MNTLSTEAVAEWTLRRDTTKRCNLPPPPPPADFMSWSQQKYLPSLEEWRALFGSGLQSSCEWFIKNLILNRGIDDVEYAVLEHIEHDVLQHCHWYDGMAYHYCTDSKNCIVAQLPTNVSLEDVKLLAIRCHACDREIQRTQSRVHSFLAVSEAIARLTLAMKDHQRDVHNSAEVQFGLDIVIEGVPEASESNQENRRFGIGQ